MANVSVVGFAKWLGAKTCGGMAQAVASPVNVTFSLMLARM